MKKHWMTALVAGSALAAAAAFAAPGFGGPDGARRNERPDRGPHGGPGLERLLQNPRIAKEAGISDAQIESLKAAEYEQRKTIIKLRGDADLARLEVRKLMQAEKVDKAAVLNAVDKAGRAMTELRKAQIEHHLAVREILGPETCAKLREMAAERFRDRQGPRQERGPRESRERFERRGPGSDRGPDAGDEGFSHQPDDDDELDLI